MVKTLYEVLSNIIYDDLIMARVDQVELELEDNKEYKQLCEDMGNVYNTIKDKLPKEDYKLLLDCEMLENNKATMLMEKSYIIGLKDGANIHESLSNILNDNKYA